MNYQVTLDPNVSFSPVNEVAEILQNVRTILKTRLGSVPLDRDFGLTWEHIDKPLQVSQALMRTEIIDTLERYEPRAKVVKIEFPSNTSNAMEGILNPVVTVSIGE